MSSHTSWRVGGPARRLYRPADSDDLCAFLAGLPADEPLLWVGLGSNLLVRDGGWPGTVLLTRGRLDGIESRDNGRLYFEAGVSCAVAARQAARAGLVGLEFFAGIPGTVGGALAMNAGAFGGETWPLVSRVVTIDNRGVRRERDPAEYRVGYRQVDGPAGEWFLGAEFELREGDVEQAQARIRELLDKRAASQPTRQPSAGSTFRNPPGDFAARLIEASGLKGERIGGAQVSEKHANFIVTEPGATATDVEQLIERVRQRVAELQQVQLQTEVHIVGEAA